MADLLNKERVGFPLPAPESAPETPEVGQDVETPAEMEPVEEAPEAAEEPVAAQEPAAPIAPVSVAAPAPAKDQMMKQIESVLEEDMTELFLAMPAAKQQAFKQKGELTASKIRDLVSKAKISAEKIFKLIRDWLKMVPGVNRFFLEQEAKIKTDKILLAAEEEKRHGL